MLWRRPGGERTMISLDQFKAVFATTKMLVGWYEKRRGKVVAALNVVESALSTVGVGGLPPGTDARASLRDDFNEVQTAFLKIDEAGDEPMGDRWVALEGVLEQARALEPRLEEVRQDGAQRIRAGLVFDAVSLPVGVDSSTAFGEAQTALSDSIQTASNLLDAGDFHGAAKAVGEAGSNHQKLVQAAKHRVSEWATAALSSTASAAQAVADAPDAVVTPAEKRAHADAREAVRAAAEGKEVDGVVEKVTTLRSTLKVGTDAIAVHQNSGYESAYGKVTGRYTAAKNVKADKPESVKLASEELDRAEHARAKAVSERRWADATSALTDLSLAANDLLVAHTKANLGKPGGDTKGELGKLLVLDGGKDLLDSIVAGVDPSTQSGGRILHAALETRFDLTYTVWDSRKKKEDDGTTPIAPTEKSASLEGGSLKRLYTLLKKVPESHSATNAKLGQIQQYVDDQGSAAYGSGVVYMNCGRATDLNQKNVTKDLSAVRYFPDGVEDIAKPDNLEPVEYFDWATLHEVGHAVDDSVKYMVNNGAHADRGGWGAPSASTIAADVGPGLGAALTPEGKTALTAFVEALVGNAAADAPPKPDEELDESAWNAAVQAAKDWRVAMSSGKGPWWKGAVSKDHAYGTDGVVYQEAYEGRWVSYLHSARRMGIHGYQFRAPGEWFAELYAAYYCKKLKTGHPFEQIIAVLPS